MSCLSANIKGIEGIPLITRFKTNYITILCKISPDSIEGIPLITRFKTYILEQSSL